MSIRTGSSTGANIGPTPLRDFQPSRLQRTPSHESISSHPLITGGSSSMPSTSIGDSPNRPGSASKYLPYTPRQRLPTPLGTATVGTSTQSPVSIPPQQHKGDATSKLQLQSLKAAAQDVGLDVGSFGWAMLEELVCGSDHGPEWNEIWNAITIGEAKLLLPLEQSNERITSDLMRDHIIFCNGASRDHAPFVTMSGLRGEISDDLVIKSTLSPASKAFVTLISPNNRSSTLLSLPPLPPVDGLQDLYPRYSLPSYSDSLPLPPRLSVTPKPPLPPRPGVRPTSSQGAAARLSNPFASFFGKAPTPSSPTLLPAAELSQTEQQVVNISAFTIDKHINRRDVSKVITKAIKLHIKEHLTGLPSWIVDRVQKYSVSLQPFPRSSKRTSEEESGSGSSSSGVTWYDSTPEDLEQSLQDFYASLENDIEAELQSSTKHRATEDGVKISELSESHHLEIELRVREVLGKVEHELCSLFYDKLFRPSNSDDASHDEALSSRVAALNILDLTLEHLGVEVDPSVAEVDSIIAACGETIQQLQYAFCPADKATILVAAHRVIVDGLSKLPPLRLKSDADNTPRQNSVNGDVRVAMMNDTDGISDSQPSDATITSSDITVQESTHNSTPPVIIMNEDSAEDQDGKADIELIDKRGTLVMSPPHTPTPVSGDVLLPVLIYSVVKSNPSQLVSHLLYTQRFRNRSVGGEESYCLINLMAVVEFLENVDLEAVGLKDSEKRILSTADLTPIPIAQASLAKERASPIEITSGIRGRVEQQVDAIAGSANKVISGVMDSSFGVLRSLLPINAEPSNDGNREHSWYPVRPSFGLLRRESGGFSIANLVPGRERTKSLPQVDIEGQEMIESRPGSIKGLRMTDPPSTYGESEEESGTGSESEETDSEEPTQDARSIRSFISGRRRSQPNGGERLSLTDRLASMSRLTRGGTHSPSSSQSLIMPDGSSTQRRTTSLSAAPILSADRSETIRTSRSPSPNPTIRLRIPAPDQRFLNCSVDDLKVSEIRELLVEYRRLAEHVQAMGDFM